MAANIQPVSTPPVLSGHTLLTLLPWIPPASWVDRIRQLHPSLRMIFHLYPNLAGRSLPDDLDPEVLKNVTILLTWRPIPDSMLQTPNLKYVQLMSAGANLVIGHKLYIDKGGPEFCTAKGVHPPQIAEWVICTWLAYQHKIRHYIETQEHGIWDRFGADDDIEDSAGLKMGILGYGAIGRQVAHLASCMGMEIHAYTLRSKPTPESRMEKTFEAFRGIGDSKGEIPLSWYSGDPKTETGNQSLQEFLGLGLDILVITAPLTKESMEMISRTEFETIHKAGKRTFISNVGRGEIINTEYLVHSLQSGWVRGAALDVTSPEPLPREHELWQMKNVFISPHISGNSKNYNNRVLDILETNLTRLAKGQELVNSVDRTVGY